MYKLYVIPGSHACRSAILMLDHKGVPYERVDVLTLAHPLVVRLKGFDSGGQTRLVGARRTVATRIGDRLGTVPALAAGRRRISTNHNIARFLDERHPDPPLFPADPERRRAVEEVESWANRELQMDSRRIALAAAEDQGNFRHRGGDGRMGYLLYRSERVRSVVIPYIRRQVFAAANPRVERELLAALPAALDRIDGWIAGGILNGEELNAADFMVAPCLALMLARVDLDPYFEGRPALDLVDRLLPESAS